MMFQIFNNFTKKPTNMLFSNKKSLEPHAKDLKEKVDEKESI